MDIYQSSRYHHEFLTPLVHAWISKLDIAERARQNWRKLADDCRMFYNRSAAAMWDPAYSRKFWAGVPAPRFRISLNLAYEYVAVFLPNLLWDMPHRKVTPKRNVEIPPELLGGEESPQFQMHQQYVQQQSSVDDLVAWQMQDWLNYTAREQQGGGLVEHSEKATVDALLTGRGCLWMRPYKMPGSDRTLTGCFYEPPEMMLTDPDFPDMDDGKWVALKHVDPHWEVEKKFGLPANSLRGKASMESSWNRGETRSIHMSQGKTNDMVVWWEIWSKTGVGSRMSGITQEVRDHLERVVGDYAYLAICASCPFPLNCSTDFLRSGATAEEVKSRLSWPVPFWADGRWPVECVDFYKNTDITDPSANWPIPPLAPAMGELKFLNFIVPWLTNRIWTSTRDFWAIAGPHVADFQKHLEEGKDMTVLPVPFGVDDVRKVVQIIQQAETRQDMWRIVELVTDMFKRRTGMVDAQYGINPTQERSAAASQAKQAAIGARPQQMQKQIVAWQSDCAACEAFVTRWFVTGNDVMPRYGPVGAQMWDQYISSSNVELVVREMQYTIAASSVRRPNRTRDQDQFMQFVQYWLATIQGYVQQTGNYEPINAMLEKYAELHDIRLDEMVLAAPQPDPAQQQQQQMEMELQQQQIQMEMQKIQAELQKSGFDLQGKQLDLQTKQIEAQLAAQQARTTAIGDELNLVNDQRSHLQEVQQDRQRHVVDLAQTEQTFDQKLRHQAAMNRQQLNNTRAQNRQRLQQQARTPQRNGEKN